jgi:hypothetical protein
METKQKFHVNLTQELYERISKLSEKKDLQRYLEDSEDRKLPGFKGAVIRKAISIGLCELEGFFS